MPRNPRIPTANCKTARGIAKLRERVWSCQASERIEMLRQQFCEGISDDQLDYDYPGWLVGERSIPAIAADELRRLLLDSLGRDHLTMKDYFDGLPQK